MLIYGYENYKIIVCYDLYNEVTMQREYREDEVENTRYKNSKYVLKTDFERISSKINISDLSSIASESKLYFSESSKFPRYKLEQTKFKRKIKPDTADYIVYKPYIPDLPEWLNVYSNNIDTLYIALNVKPNKENLTLLTQHVYPLSDATKSYLDLTKTKHKYITDDQLNELCDKCAPDLTDDAFNQILNLCFSENVENIGLGLKLFATYNVSKYPMTARFLLSCTDTRVITNNITIKNLKTQADVVFPLYRHLYRNMVGYWDATRFYNRSNIETATVEDRNFASKILHKFVKIHQYTNDFTRYADCPWFNQKYYDEA
jgi:hypothetical protein